MTLPRGNLPAINFAEKSATTIEADIITTYEGLARAHIITGRPSAHISGGYCRHYC